MSSASTSSPAPVQPLTERPAWKAHTQHYRAVRGLHLQQLFAEDPRRRERLTPERLKARQFDQRFDLALSPVQESTIMNSCNPVNGMPSLTSIAGAE